MNKVVLTVDGFRDRYDVFSNVTDNALPELFIMASLYLDNTYRSQITNLDERETLLYLLVAHLCYILHGDNKKNGGSGMVGRISSASEGSVSVSSDIGAVAFRNAWYTQSPYGWMFWQATKVYRMGAWFSGTDYR
ncbi:DUF4054 domain-containing protein [Morganella morganii]|uniref:DUF4054 domain-containing protein n=1 Tax=Morganella morganii TaxID=582 RepID=UPI00339C07A6